MDKQNPGAWELVTMTSAEALAIVCVDGKMYLSPLAGIPTALARPSTAKTKWAFNICAKLQ